MAQGAEVISRSVRAHASSRLVHQLVLVALLVVTGLALKLFGARRTLLGKASPTAIAFDHIDGEYMWITDKQILVMQPASQGSLANLHANCCNTVSGACEPLTGINRLLDARHTPGSRVWSLSPDGKRLVASDGLSSHPHFTAAGIDGSERATWSQSDPAASKCLWMPDSTRWISVTLNQTVAHVCVHQPGASDTSLSLPPARSVLGFTGPSKLLTYDLYTYGRFQRAHFEEWNLGRIAHLDQQWDVRVPDDVRNVDEIILSPKGDRLLWSVTSRTSDNSRWLEKSFSHIGYHRHRIFSLRVSNLDGTHMREIGAQSIDQDEVMSNWWPIYGAWTPDGQRASFLYHRILYTVPLT